MLLHELFCDSVTRHGDAPALEVPPGEHRGERLTLTYRQLAALADRVQAALAASVEAEARVVVLLPRSDPWSFAAQLGVLQAGSAHVCLDPSFPDDYVAQVVADAGAVAIVTDAAGAARCAGLATTVLVTPLVGGPASAIAARSCSPPRTAPGSLAYVIYTSGTTGRPKGVLLEHRGAVNLIIEGVRRFGIGPGDRIAQGSSAAYDSSIEETWLALASGATLVVLDDATVRLGPDLVPWLRRERVTVLCPPPTLLRAMDLRAPAQALPALRLCYVGGEPLSDDLATTWGGALWLENGYGPTECTVTVVRGRVRPGEPVTIGEPVPPHRALLLDEHLRPVADGEAGELCIAGPGLARGYLGHDALTRERFPVLDGVGRVYRTGDLVVRDADGRLRCLGRIDAQVKVRGYRIELESVEALLAAGDGVREVVCAVQGEEPDRELVAFVVLRDAQAPPDFAALARAVAARSPAYAVPTRFALLERVPRTVGGKVDRRALPQLVTPRAGDTAGEATTPLQRVLAAMAGVLGCDAQQLSPDDDFFAVGGNSLRAAMLVSRLRRWPELASVAVRDVYATPHAAGLAATLAARAPAVGHEVHQRTTPPPVFAFTVVQLSVLACSLSTIAALAYGLAFGVLPWLLASWSLPTLLLLAPWLAVGARLLFAAGSYWLLLVAKELLIGAYRPGRVSAWSGLRLRHWIVTNLARAVPWALVEGTELHVAMLRGLGARIGRRVHLHRGVDLTGGGWDLLEIGDDATLGREVDLGLCELHDGQLVIGAVRIGASAVLEARSGTAGDVVVGDGAVLGPLAFAAAGARVGAGELWRGVPAARVGAAAPVAPCRERSSWRCTWQLLVGRWLLAPLAQTPLLLLLLWLTEHSGADAAALHDWLCADGPSSQPTWWWTAVLLPVLWLPFALLGAALWLRFTPRIAAGELPRWSNRWYWLASRTALVERAGLWLSGTLFWPWWLRLAGMRIGRDVEVSTILDVLPERTAIGGGSFLADGVYLGVPAIRAGRVTVADTSFGERTFVGNHVVVPAGERLPDDLLLGVCTVGDAATMRAGSAWFGQPAMRLPQREVIEVDRRLTHEPGALRYANRMFWEALRLLLPVVPTMLALWWFDAVAAGGFAAAVGASLAVAAALAFVVLATKWLLLGRVRPGQHGLWSCWASRWDFHYVLWQRYGRALLMPLEGTLLLGWFLRAIGVRLGRRCVLGRGFAQVVDPDMLTIEDGATVHALFQAHSFEDRVLKIGPVRLGAGCTVGRAAVVLYGADIGEGARVAPHSVVMKHELLLPGRDYAGAPSVEVARAAATAAVAAADAPPAGERLVALDVARGLAVLGMVWLHFVPEPDDPAASFGAAVVDAGLRWLEGVPAALFLLLAGVAWALSGRRDAGYVSRRALALVAIGLPFWWFVWPNDVLMPLALMLPLVIALLVRGRGALVAGVATMLLAAPLVVHFAGEVAATDQLDNGMHRAHGQWSWATLRYFTIDGAYPLLPWLMLPLLGALLGELLVDAARDAARLARWCWLALPCPAVAWLCTTAAEDLGEHLGDGLAAQLAANWSPTSLPFLLRCGGTAVAIAAGLVWWAAARGMPRWLGPVAAVGRASLTHYLLHTAGVYALLRLWWPEEDWSLAVGLAVAGGYLVFALLASPLWFCCFRRGPLEALLRLVSRGRS